MIGLLSLFVFGFASAQDYIDATQLGGETTTYSRGLSAMAFQQPAANLSEEQVARHIKGDSLFGRNFSSDSSHDLSGLGPVYNNSSCNACHARDGRGALPVIPRGQEWVQLKQNEAVFLKISLEDNYKGEKSSANNFGAPVAVPGYGTQLFHVGLFSVRPDAPGTGQAKVWMKYEYANFEFPDGEVLRLRQPLFKITDAYDPRIYAEDVRFSARIGTPMIGLGLLEAIREEDILALAARDLSAFGIQGRPNYVYDVVKDMAADPYPVSLGRFGLKANTPSVYQQTMGALVNDMGVTNEAFPLESIVGTELYRSLGLDSAPKIEIPTPLAEDIIFYALTLGVPNRRNVENPQVVRGAQLFNQIGCALCHHPSFVTGPSHISQFSNQKIYPFTDMLLHDMGEGLADNRRDFDASGRQWKTRPLWGLGHTQTINPRAGFLHDGRAKTLEEAIVWHGGEAAQSQKAFVYLSKEDRDALVSFLQSL